jgi:hypothetical protein
MRRTKVERCLSGTRKQTVQLGSVQNQHNFLIDTRVLKLGSRDARLAQEVNIVSHGRRRSLDEAGNKEYLLSED